MTPDSIREATRVFGAVIGNPGNWDSLRALGVMGPEESSPVLCTLATTTVAEVRLVVDDLGGTPIVVIDVEHGRIARLNFCHEPVDGAVQVGPASEMGAIVDLIAALRSDPDLSLLGLLAADIQGLAPA